MCTVRGHRLIVSSFGDVFILLKHLFTNAGATCDFQVALSATLDRNIRQPKGFNLHDVCMTTRTTLIFMIICIVTELESYPLGPIDGPIFEPGCIKRECISLSSVQIFGGNMTPRAIIFLWLIGFPVTAKAGSMTRRKYRRPLESS